MDNFKYLLVLLTVVILAGAIVLHGYLIYNGLVDGLLQIGQAIGYK